MVTKDQWQMTMNKQEINKLNLKTDDTTTLTTFLQTFLYNVLFTDKMKGFSFEIGFIQGKPHVLICNSKKIYVFRKIATFTKKK